VNSLDIKQPCTVRLFPDLPDHTSSSYATLAITTGGEHCQQLDVPILGMVVGNPHPVLVLVSTYNVMSFAEPYKMSGLSSLLGVANVGKCHLSRKHTHLTQKIVLNS
jgi:hypothetical protein